MSTTMANRTSTDEMTLKQVVDRISLTLLKIRSIADENKDDDLMTLLLPAIHADGPIGYGLLSDRPEINILEVCTRIQQTDVYAPMDVYNLLALCRNADNHKYAGISAMFGLRWHTDLPEPAWALHPARKVR